MTISSQPKYLLKVKEEIDKLLEARFIFPVPHNIVIVPKKVGVDEMMKIRVCQDFWKLNEATKKDYYPLPFTDIILDHVARHECYSLMDVVSGHHQVWIQEQDQIFTMFTPNWGTFAF